MKTFNLNLFEGHPIIQEGENIILIDTGCPQTIHVKNQFEFLEGKYNVLTNYGGITIQGFSNLIGMNITTLLGADILRDFEIIFDYRNTSVTFSKEAIDNFEGTTVAFSTAISVPIISVIINNRNANCFLDTGAKFSYINNSFVQNLKSDGIGNDFYIGIGHFQRPYFTLETNFGNNFASVRYLTPPDAVQNILNATRVDGILGYDFFYHFRFLLNLKEKKLTYKN